MTDVPYDQAADDHHDHEASDLEWESTWAEEIGPPGEGGEPVESEGGED